MGQKSYWRYWGKADPKYPDEPKWHPLVYHCLDVAAVVASWWDRSPVIRRTFVSAFGLSASAPNQLRAWVLFFVALHDLGKIDVRFQLKAENAIQQAWPELAFDDTDPSLARGFDHGHWGYAWAVHECPEWVDSRNAAEVRDRWRPLLAAVTGHHGDLPQGSDIEREYAEEYLMGHDRRSRRAFVEELAGLFLAPEALSLNALLPSCTTASQALLAGFCAVCDWIGSNAMGKATDIALSGRMATSGLMTSLPIDGALCMAHAITTHAVEPQDVDWFTAVDDLTQDAGETGAGHLNTQQFSAGVFYRYASLNLKQLQVNLGLLPDMKAVDTPESRKRALEIAKHVFHMLATVVPSAKQQSFAAHNPSDFAIVSFGDQPISLANVFEQPVKRARDGGYFSPSVQCLADYWQRIDQAYNLNEQARAFSVKDAMGLGGRLPFGSLREMESWIEKDGHP